MVYNLLTKHKLKIQEWVSHPLQTTAYFSGDWVDDFDRAHAKGGRVGVRVAPLIDDWGGSKLKQFRYLYKYIWPWFKTQLYHFGVGAPPILVYFSGVHKGVRYFDPWPYVERERERDWVHTVLCASDF